MRSVCLAPFCRKENRGTERWLSQNSHSQEKRIIRFWMYVWLALKTMIFLEPPGLTILHQPQKCAWLKKKGSSVWSSRSPYSYYLPFLWPNSWHLYRDWFVYPQVPFLSPSYTETAVLENINIPRRNFSKTSESCGMMEKNETSKTDSTMTCVWYWTCFMSPLWALCHSTPACPNFSKP